MKQIVYKRIEELIPYEKNPRNNKPAIDAVANSIKEFGFQVPIVIDKDNVIVAGHTRFAASKKLKLKEVPCIVADELTEAQIKAYRLADNKTGELAEWDIELLDLELKDLELDFNMEDFGFDLKDFEDEPTEIVEDEAPEVDMEHEPISKYGQVYQLGNHRLMCGDSTKMEDVKKLMNGNLAHMVITDPPYNVNYEGGTDEKLKIANDNMDSNSFHDFLVKAFNCLKENLIPGGGILHLVCRHRNA